MCYPGNCKYLDESGECQKKYSTRYPADALCRQKNTKIVLVDNETREFTFVENI
jgi:hypothetical protein